MNSVTEKTTPIYSKEISVMMAGVAIILMMALHLFAHPEWLNEGVGWHSLLGYYGDRFTLLISQYGGVCVNIFALTSGYVLIANPKAYSTFKARSKRLFNFLIAYWVVYALFLIIGAINNDTMPPIKQLLTNSFGLRLAPFCIDVPFAWYVSYYIEFIVLIPVLLWLFKGRNIARDLAITMLLIPAVRIGLLYAIVAINPVYKYGLPYDAVSHLFPIVSTCFGIIIAKYSLFDKVHQLIGKKLNVPTIIVLIGAVFVGVYMLTNINKWGGVDSNLNFIQSTILNIFPLILMQLLIELLIRVKSRYIKQPLLTLGKYSMYLWFLHGIFFTGKNLLQPQLYSLKDPIIILTVCIICLLPIAYLLQRFVALLLSLPGKIRAY